MTALTAAQAGLASCPSCFLVSALGDQETGVCPRCAATLYRRRPDSLGRTTAFLLAAAVLFVPANLLPVMTTTTLLGERSDTIASGALALWTSGSWPLALLVFVASVLIPGLKIAGMALLVASSWRRSPRGRRARARLYRVIEAVGRWSMLDVFVLALLAAVVRTNVLSVTIDAGAVAFGGVVVATMLSSRSFDPRLIWESKEEHLS
jgi:paraquat-inducible protein A